MWTTRQKIPLQQIHKLDNEYDIITNQQKLSQEDRNRLIEIDKQIEISAKQDTNENKQRPDHRNNHQQQYTQHVLPTKCDRTHKSDNVKHTMKIENTAP